MPFTINLITHDRPEAELNELTSEKARELAAIVPTTARVEPSPDEKPLG